jgi:ribose transport system permease protein
MSSSPPSTSPDRHGAEDRASPPATHRARPWHQRILSAPATRIFGVLLLLLLAFSVLRPRQFSTEANLINIASDAAVLLVLAAGSTCVIITSGIDLSINGVVVFSGVMAALLMRTVGGEGPLVLLLGLIAALVAGLAWGLLNGSLIAKAGIPALIVTLGTLGASLGLALVLTRGVDISEVPLTLITTVGSGRIGRVPWLVVIACAVALLVGLVLAYTRFGRYTYAIGSNAEALRRAGVNTSRHLIRIYALAGLMSGLAGYLSLARFATTTLGGHSSDNLQTIAGVVIGGTSLFGGVGTMVGSVIGVMIPAVLQNGFVVLDVQPFWQQVAVGVVLIVAVYLDQLRRRSRSRS